MDGRTSAGELAILGAFCEILNIENFQSDPLPNPHRYRAKWLPKRYHPAWDGFWARMSALAGFFALGLGFSVPQYLTVEGNSLRWQWWQGQNAPGATERCS